MSSPYQCAELLKCYFVWPPDDSMRMVKQIQIRHYPQVRDGEIEFKQGQATCARSHRGIWIHLNHIPVCFYMLFFFFLNVHSGHLGASTLNPLQLKEEISPLVLRLGERFFLLCCGCLILSVVGSWVELQSLVQVGHNIPEHSTVIRGPMSFREFAECYRSGPRNMKSCFPTPSSWGLHLRAARFCFKLTSGRA